MQKTVCRKVGFRVIDLFLTALSGIEQKQITVGMREERMQIAFPQQPWILSKNMDGIPISLVKFAKADVGFTLNQIEAFLVTALSDMLYMIFEERLEEAKYVLNLN